MTLCRLASSRQTHARWGSIRQCKILQENSMNRDSCFCPEATHLLKPLNPRWWISPARTLFPPHDQRRLPLLLREGRGGAWEPRSRGAARERTCQLGCPHTCMQGTCVSDDRDGQGGRQAWRGGWGPSLPSLLFPAQNPRDPGIPNSYLVSKPLRSYMCHMYSSFIIFFIFCILECFDILADPRGTAPVRAGQFLEKEYNSPESKFYFGGFFPAAPMAYGSSQARDRV